MNRRIGLWAFAAVISAAAISSTVHAQPYPGGPPGSDPYGYYSQYDRDGYYDRNGNYRRFRDYRGGDYGPPPPSDSYGYYREGDYERDCRRNNRAAGTIFGAIGGGLIGGAASHGNAGAVVGGVLIGGLLGNAIAGDIECDDRRYAFDVYYQGLNGDIGRRYEWHHGRAYGYFTPTREYRDGGRICRDFTTVTYRRNGDMRQHDGTACRWPDGTWRFR